MSISDYLEASKELHKSNPEYGKASEYENKSSMKYMLAIPAAWDNLCQKFNTNSILDYGIGKGGLVDTLSINASLDQDIQGYEPAVERFMKKPNKKFDVVTSIDVLEHISHQEIDNILTDIAKFTGGFFFFCIDLLPASKKTVDKRNAHFLLAPTDWWASKIKQKFKICTFIEVGELENQSEYPIHLFGCATNSMKQFSRINCFLENINAIHYRWVWNPKMGGCSLKKY